MIIGIDASRAMRPVRTGTETYNAEIIKHLIKIDSKNTYRLYAHKEPEGDLVNLGPNVEWRVMPFSKGWTLIRLSLEMLRNKPDVLFIPAHTIPLISGKKTVVMIHDIGFDHFPELYKKTDIIYHHFDLWWAKRRANHILVPSDFTKQDLHEKYRIATNRMTTIHHGFTGEGFRPASPGETPPRNVPYFYYIGRLEYKKNISRMLHAFGAFKKETGLPHKFLLAGKPAHGFEDIERHCEALGPYKDDVEFLGYVSEPDYQHQLRHAESLLFCSLFEGFGIPVLDAFASHTPVITSNTTSLPEIAGDAAIQVNPTQVSEITQAMIEVATKPAIRKELAKKGSERVKQFSWEKSAKETLQVLVAAGERST